MLVLFIIYYIVNQIIIISNMNYRFIYSMLIMFLLLRMCHLKLYFYMLSNI